MGEAGTHSANVTVTEHPTEYVVLHMGDSFYWEVLKTVKARSADAAVRAIGKEGHYVAIPSRSWKPTKVSAVQTTVLKLEEAATPPPAGPS